MKLVSTVAFNHHQAALMAKFFRTIRLTLALVLAVASLQCNAQIQSKLPHDYESDVAMQKALKAAGLDIYATQKNRQILADTEKILQKIKTDLGKNYAGDWIAYDNNNEVHRYIATTQPIGAAQKQSYGIENEIIFFDVKYNYSNLNAAYQKIGQMVLFNSKIGKNLIFTAGLDVKLNRIVVGAREENFESIRYELLTSGIDLEIIVLEKGEPLPSMNLLIKQ